MHAGRLPGGGACRVGGWGRSGMHAGRVGLPAGWVGEITYSHILRLPPPNPGTCMEDEAGGLSE